MTQKTKTIDKNKTDSVRNKTTTSEEPPSWSELASKMGVKGTSIATVSSLILGLLVLPIPIAVFLVSIVLSSFGLTNTKSSAIAGGLAGGISALISIFFSISAILLTIGTVGLFGVATILPTLILGALAGLVGGYIGDKVF